MTFFQCQAPYCVDLVTNLCAHKSNCPIEVSVAIGITQKRQILLMEDDLYLGPLCESLLEDEGYKVTLVPG